jgi:hypothetical protein
MEQSDSRQASKHVRSVRSIGLALGQLLTTRENDELAMGADSVM